MSHMKDLFKKLYGEDTIRRVSFFAKRVTLMMSLGQTTGTSSQVTFFVLLKCKIPHIRSEFLLWFYLFSVFLIFSEFPCKHTLNLEAHWLNIWVVIRPVFLGLGIRFLIFSQTYKFRDVCHMCCLPNNHHLVSKPLTTVF